MTETVSTPPPPVEGRKHKPLRIILLVLVSMIIIVAIFGGIYSWLFTSSIGKININEVDIATLPDGTYHGSYKKYHVSVEVVVTIEDHQVAGIEIINDVWNKQVIAEVLNKVVQEQSLQVELVSGASANQKVALKAVEEALTENR